MTWIETSRRKKESLAELIPPKWRLSIDAGVESSYNLDVSGFVPSQLNTTERQITDNNAEQLLACIATGDMTSYEVVQAFCHRAAIAHHLV